MRVENSESHFTTKSKKTGADLMDTTQFYRELMSEFAVKGLITALDCYEAVESVLSRNDTSLRELGEAISC